MEHEDIVHAEEEVTEAWVAAPVLECEWVIYGYVATIGSA